MLWLPQVVQAMGSSVTNVGLQVALVFVLVAGGMALWGYSSDVHEDRVWHIVIAGLAAAGGMSLAAASHSNFVVLAALAIAAIASTSAIPLLNCLTTGLLRGRAAAGGFALFNMIANLGGFIGPLVIGYKKQASGGFSAGFIALALSEVVCATIVLSLNRAVTHRAILPAALKNKHER
jgi:ACS family tartrate transporter-like MFS transporter